MPPMRLEMPDGTSIVLVPHDDGVVIGTSGLRLADGSYPPPSGLLVSGTDADVLGALILVIEDAEIASVIGELDEVEPEPEQEPIAEVFAELADVLAAPEFFGFNRHPPRTSRPDYHRKRGIPE